MLTNLQMIVLGLIGGLVRVLVGYSKAYGPLSYPPPFLWKRAALTIFVALLTGAIAPFLAGVDSIGIAFVAGFAGCDLLEALAKGLMKVKTGFSTGFGKSRYGEFGAAGSDSKMDRKFQKALEYIDKNGKITNNDYQKINRVSDSTAARDIKKMQSIGLIKKLGSGSKTYYKAK